MINPFEQIEKSIQELGLKVESLESKVKGEKRWLNTNETAIYLGYSKEHVPKLKTAYFIEGVHFYKQAGRVLFDKIELDKWVMQSVNKMSAKDIAESIMKDLT